ncbi:MAG: DUF421 domain-containing protein [Pedobacter sp.]|uniref:DUF421 domain-containing protein n=1 Tax=Pedobacter sp. TaxID=1411316 RepID=UPI0028081241|nr:YetF domain-containing protein [Pedobacter sp.]MDQ8003421.1 DUF421 domain-containing protein [Pedobacter sp.]
MADGFKNFEKILLGEEDWSFIPEIMFRTLIMYLVVLVGLRVLGKRGVRQLSIFELVVIISLGSAAGDPMFYKEVGVVSAIAVFTVVIIAYRATAHFVNKNKKLEVLLEGKCTCVIENGRFAIENFEKENLAQDEFFAELRLKGISHLGQVKLAILETNGSISVFYYKDDDVKYGLPILPALFCNKAQEIKYRDYYSCSFCGLTQLSEPAPKQMCRCCKKDKWVKAISILRVT